MDIRNKYRAWLTEEKRMINVVNMQWNRLGLFVSEKLNVNNYFEPNRYILLQCTGLSAVKSYRGNKPEDLIIWQGDIVKNDIVKFGNPDLLKDSQCSMFYWKMTEQLDYTHFCFEDDVFTEFKNVEIIGNIYDSPKLLTDSNPRLVV